MRGRTGVGFTIGHSTRTLEEFITLLRESDVTFLGDVRAIPHSRRVPQFSIDTLPASLRAANIEYGHFPGLGGRRRKPKDAPPSPNTYWRIDAFRAYADYAESPAFADALDELLERAGAKRFAIMCAEAVWWRCHRRIVTDYLLARDLEMWHIMAPGKTERATLTPGAQVLSSRAIRYVREPQLFTS